MNEKIGASDSSTSRSNRLLEVILLFLRLGITAFGGPAAHIALMREAVVMRRKWLTEQQFLDLLGATNLIPGPNSTEMAIHLGYLRAGMPGLVAGGASFILPAMLIVMAMAWAYVRYGSTPEVSWIFYGIKPVVIAIVAYALWNLARPAIKNRTLAGLSVVVLALYLLGINELALLFAAGLLWMLFRNLTNRGPGIQGLALVLPGAAAALSPTALLAQASFQLSTLFLLFLKIGSVLYGSGYVLLAFLRADFVERLGWLTEAQLLEAIAVGQVTPGPVFTTATFIGYLLGGVPGGVLATVGIFLPGFVFVALTNPIIPRLRQSPWASALLDGVNAASVALMAGVTLQLARASLVDWLTGLLALVSAWLLFRYKINATWLIALGGLVGVIRYLIG